MRIKQEHMLTTFPFINAIRLDLRNKLDKLVKEIEAGKTTLHPAADANDEDEEEVDDVEVEEETEEEIDAEIDDDDQDEKPEEQSENKDLELVKKSPVAIPIKD